MTGGPAIVVLDDEAYQRRVIAEFLARHGLRPTALASGAELKRLAQQSMPDVVLLDVHLAMPRTASTLPAGCAPDRAASASSC